MTVKKLSRYDLVAVVAQGKLGPVWDGYDPDIRRKVTIKTAPVDHLSDAAAEALVARFRAEARVAGKLTHPNIVGVYDAGVESGLAYIVTETVTGTSLDAVLRQPGGLPPEAVGRTILQLLSALDYAHGLGVFHLGLQPSLLTVTSSGSVKVSDFGAVAAAEPDDSTRAQASLSEHIRYLAPEQVLGLEADARADLWAVGVMLYRLWVGRWPFNADSDFGLIQQVIKQPVALPSSVDPERSAEHDQLVARALAKSAGDRYPNAREMAADLSRIMSRALAGAMGAGSGTLPGIATPRFSETVPLGKPAAAPATPSLAAAAAPAEADELARWQRIQLSERPADFEAFLADHPSGAVANLARRRLQRLTGAGESAPVAGDTAEPVPPSASDDETRMVRAVPKAPMAPPAPPAPPAPLAAAAPAAAPLPAPAPELMAAMTAAHPVTPPVEPRPEARAESKPAAAKPAKEPPATEKHAAAAASPRSPLLPVLAGLALVGAAAAWWLLKGSGGAAPAAPPVAAASAPAAVASAPEAAPAPVEAAQAPASSGTPAPIAAAEVMPPPASAAGAGVPPAATPGTAATVPVVAAASAAKAPSPREQAAARKAAADALARAKASASQAAAPAAPVRAVEEARPAVPVAEAPKPVEAPASVAAAPAQPCANRVFLARLSCMKESCQQGQWAAHPQCVEFRRLDEANRGRRGEQ